MNEDDKYKSYSNFNCKISSYSFQREQVVNLMNIFLRWGIIVKLYPCSNLFRFQDNKDLYTLSSDDEEMRKSNEPVYETISKSTNDLLSSNNRSSFRMNRSIYRSFGKSTYNQIQNTIKKTTSTIIKTTNHSVSKFTNHTLSKLNNRSGNNLIRKLNNNLINKSSNMINKLNSNSIKRSTSVLNKPNNRLINTLIKRPFTRSFKLDSNLDDQDKENLIVNNHKFVRNYRGNLQLNGSFNPTKLSSIASNSPINSRIKNFSTSLNASAKDAISLDPMINEEENFCLTCKIDNEGSNIIRFLTKLSDGLKKKPLKPLNTSLNPNSSTNNSLASSMNSQIILNKNTIQFKSNQMPVVFKQTKECLINPISSTCYNTLV